MLPMFGDVDIAHSSAFIVNNFQTPFGDDCGLERKEKNKQENEQGNESAAGVLSRFGDPTREFHGSKGGLEVFQFREKTKLLIPELANAPANSALFLPCGLAHNVNPNQLLTGDYKFGRRQFHLIDGRQNGRRVTP